MKRIKLDIDEAAALGSATLFHLTVVALTADALGKGLKLTASEQDTIRHLIFYGVLAPSRTKPELLEIAPAIRSALLRLSAATPNLAGALGELKPALENGLIQIPISALTPQ